MRKWYIAGLCLVLFTLMVGCGSGGNENNGVNASASNSTNTSVQPEKETTLAKAQREGYVKVGFANENPYAYATADGKLTGEAVEVARKVLANMGIPEMDGVLTEFGSLIPGLKANRFDIITAGMFINPDRAKEVDFANPEYSIGEAIAVKKGNPLDLHSYKDIADNGKAKIAVMTGAVELDYLKGSGVGDDQIVQVPDQPSAIAALQAGRADAITMTGPSLQAVLESAADDGIERVMEFEQPVIDGVSVRGYGAAAFRQEDDDFREAFNAELQKLKDSGELLEILKPFGFTEQELPGDMTADQLSQ
ncbi:ectoine/hydroxyectoine ABC transporter substrate-binding protein EhuB [Cohnella lubricantis]|uniref:Ectoine/hydroxyectoine ABC transporter substrate-binding protein EhuB n=1 Tax=Cohnella lubricantis TaxID=2163172 RepID=A0A841TDV7_9BACL|nr:ectoine/hydroxyectoine ABC transporter substrate-binding protein EhuB [Cohnella lubricantis]MBB6678225.1 ectoine/hydroxyectoine ABC transporter substrate-binding protein EhuB [Cohnella lubricantis]MBP2120080.1 polar amino acid transport system substrate-binding protein [Cohnella lubricantis]